MASLKNAERREGGERAQRLGDLAHTEVELMLKRAHLTVNGSHSDKEGWDLFVQFPTSLEIRPFLDMSPPTHSCLIQVKSFEDTTATVRHKLSNALKLAKTPMPVFIVVARMSDDKVSELWVIHCDRAFVASVLESAAKATSSKQDGLNDIKITIPRPDATRVNVDAQSLRKALESHMDPHPEAYLRKKQDWLRNVGYGEDRKELTVTFGTTDAQYSEMAEFAVGLRHRLRVNRIDVSDLRFGLNRPERGIESPELEWPAVPTGPTIDVIVGRPGESVHLRCTTHSSQAIFPFLPQRFARFVMRAPFITFSSQIVDNNFAKLTWTIEGLDHGIALSELRHAADAALCMRLISQGDATMRIAGMPDMPLAFRGASDENPTSRLQVLEDIFAVAPHMSLPDNYRFDMSSLNRQADHLRLLGIALGGVDMDMIFGFVPSTLTGAPNVGDVLAMMFMPGVRFSTITMVCVCAAVGSLEASMDADDKQFVRTRQFRLLSKKILRDGEVDVDSMYTEAQATLEREGVKNFYRHSSS